MTLDDWSDEDVDAMIEVGGNSSANSIYEAHFPEGVSKIPPDASVEQRTKYIRYSLCHVMHCIRYHTKLLSSRLHHD